MDERKMIYLDDAIDAANRADYRGLAVEDVRNVTDEVVKELKRVPSAQPEQRTGKWIHDGGDWKNRWVCSNCGHKWFFDKTEAVYCPNCGADMRGAQDG